MPVPAFSQTLRLFRLTTAVFCRGRMLLWWRLTLLQLLLLLGVLLHQRVGLLLVLLFQLLVSLVAGFLLGRTLVVFLLLRRQLLEFVILLLLQFVLLSLVFLVQCRISGVRRGARCGLNVFDVARLAAGVAASVRATLLFRCALLRCSPRVQEPCKERRLLVPPRLHCPWIHSPAALRQSAAVPGSLKHEAPDCCVRRPRAASAPLLAGCVAHLPPVPALRWRELPLRHCLRCNSPGC